MLYGSKPVRRNGSRGTEPKRRLWRIKRGVVLNRNEHATGREQATIEVAEPQSPGAELEAAEVSNVSLATLNFPFASCLLERE